VFGHGLRVSMSETLLKMRSDQVTRDTDKITTLVDANPHLTVREIQEILGMLHRSIVAQRHHLCEQNGCVDAAQTERQEPAALECMRLPRQHKKLKDN